MDNKYWKGLEELSADPLKQKELEESRGQEFQTSPLKVEEADSEAEFNRRDFLKVMGAGLAMLGTACTRRPVEKILPYVDQPPEVTPGIANWYASTCRGCDVGCGILVKSKEGRPIKVEGNPEHKYSQGGLCAQGQGHLLSLYDPDRLQAPQKVNRSTGAMAASSWDDLSKAVLESFKKSRSAGKKIVMVTGRASSGSMKSLQQLLTTSWNVQEVSVNPFYEDEEGAVSSAVSYGVSSQLPQYRFEEAKVIVSLGADFLGTWGATVENTRSFTKSRKVDDGHRPSRLFVFESLFSLTGAQADVRLSVAPEALYWIARGLGHELVTHHGLSSSVPSWNEFFRETSVLNHLSQWGVDLKVLQKAARELAQHRGGKAMVLGAGTGNSELGVSTVNVVVNALNSLLGAEGTLIQAKPYVSVTQSQTKSYARADFIKDLESGVVGTIIVWGSNPGFLLGKESWRKLTGKTDLVLTIGAYADETALESDYIAAESHAFESWGDHEYRSGAFSIQQPTIRPLYDTKEAGDLFLSWTQASEKTWHDFLKRSWEKTIYPKVQSKGLGFEAFWNQSLQRGFVDTNSSSATAPARTLKSESLQIAKNEAPFVRASSSQQQTELSLVAYQKAGMGDGRHNNNAWLQELPDPVTKITWENYLSLGVGYAHNKGLQEGDVVRISSARGALEVPVHIQPGQSDSVGALAVGYGRTHSGRVGQQKGVNVFEVRPFMESSTPVRVSLEKTGKNHPLASTQQHHSMEGRPIVLEQTYEKFTQGGHHGKGEHETLLTIWPEHQYEGYRWAMGIDLSACTGCGACVISCQAENNIPVVGYKDILNGREMHWIRIDRYYSGTPESPDAVFQPMLCQHCENAPCETVCPVIATAHDGEGLNQQIYNRCVGTRYCANNCPYKVRRFNWYTYTQVEKPLNFQYNPEVTVRTRGVMEKCTFCSHRIREVKGRAKDLNRRVQDGEMKTACQQSCPAQAIVFGDINDPKSEVSRWARHKRGYKVLEEINVKPSVTYLKKIRNRSSEEEVRS